jgi:hypothetical protein
MTTNDKGTTVSLYIFNANSLMKNQGEVNYEWAPENLTSVEEQSSVQQTSNQPNSSYYSSGSPYYGISQDSATSSQSVGGYDGYSTNADAASSQSGGNQPSSSSYSSSGLHTTSSGSSYYGNSQDSATSSQSVGGYNYYTSANAASSQSGGNQYQNTMDAVPPSWVDAESDRAMKDQRSQPWTDPNARSKKGNENVDGPWTMAA